MRRATLWLGVFPLVCILAYAIGTSDFEGSSVVLVVEVVAGLIVASMIAPRHEGGVSALGAIALWVAIVALAVGSVLALSWLGMAAVLPLVGIAAVAVVLATLLTRPRRLRRLREQAGLCTECGYDLRASFERCPECGSPIPEELVRRRRIAEELATRKAERQRMP